MGTTQKVMAQRKWLSFQGCWSNEQRTSVEGRVIPFCSSLPDHCRHTFCALHCRAAGRYQSLDHLVALSCVVYCLLWAPKIPHAHLRLHQLLIAQSSGAKGNKVAGVGC